MEKLRNRLVNTRAMRRRNKQTQRWALMLRFILGEISWLSLGSRRFMRMRRGLRSTTHARLRRPAHQGKARKRGQREGGGDRERRAVGGALDHVGKQQRRRRLDDQRRAG